LALLEDALTTEGTSGVVFAGAAGVGKTRLARESLHAAESKRNAEAERSVWQQGQFKLSAVGPSVADWPAIGFVKHVVLPGKQGVPADALPATVNTACPPRNGGPVGSAYSVIGTVLWPPSQVNSNAGKKLPVVADPWAIALPAACSTSMCMFSENSVSDESNGEHATVTGAVIATRLVRLGVPRLTVIASAVDGIPAHAAMIAAAGHSFPNMVFVLSMVTLS
jgi:hypothetical protein